MTVATSDGLEQIIIRGQGCRLVSAECKGLFFTPNVINLVASLTILRLAVHALCGLEQHCDELIANSD